MVTPPDDSISPTTLMGRMAVGAGGVTEYDVVAGQAPIFVSNEVDLLVDNSVADPGALFTCGAIGVRVEGVELHSAHAGAVQSVQCWVAAREVGAACPRVRLLPDPQRSDRRAPRVWGVQSNVSEAQPIDLGGGESPGATHGHKTRPGGWVARGYAPGPEGSLLVVAVERRSCRRVELDLDNASDDAPEVQSEQHAPVRPDLDRKGERRVAERQRRHT